MLKIESSILDLKARLAKEMKEGVFLKHTIENYCRDLTFKSEHMMKLIEIDFKGQEQRVERFSKGEDAKEIEATIMAAEAERQVNEASKEKFNTYKATKAAFIEEFSK